MSDRSRWWVLCNVVAVNVLVTGIAWNYIIMFVPDVVGDLGIGLADWGTLWSGIALGVLLFSMPAGAAADRFGVRAAMGSALALAGATLLLRGQATNSLSMIAAMVGFGIALALVMSSFPKAIAQTFPASELGMANGIAQAGVGLGLGSATLVAPVVAPLLGGWRGLTHALGFTSIALALVWVASVREAGNARGASTDAGGLRAIARVLRIREVRLVAACYLLYMGGYLGAIGYLPTHLTLTGLSPEAAGALVSLGPWSFLVGSLTLPTLSDRVGRRRAIYLPGMAIGGLSLFALCYASGVGIAVCIIGLGFGTGVVGLLFVIPVESEGVGEHLAASAVGVATTAGFLGGFLSPLIGMPLVTSVDVLGFGFWSACFVASALLILAVRERGVGAR